MAMDEKSLGKQLQSMRLGANLTQQQLCQKANISFSTLTKIERGAIKSPSVFTVLAIANAVGVGLDELIGNRSGHAPGRVLKKTKSGNSFIYFDVNGCLVHFYQRAFAKLAESTGVPSDMVETAFWHYNDEVCKGTITIAEFNANLAKKIGVDSVRWQDYYLENVEPIVKMQETLKWASERYRVGLLTNIMPGLLSAMRKNEQLPNIHYDAIVDSSEAAAVKPEPEIFEIARDKAGVPANQILLIDDSRVNLMAAEKQGWHTLWFDDSRVEESVKRVLSALQPAD